MDANLNWTSIHETLLFQHIYIYIYTHIYSYGIETVYLTYMMGMPKLVSAYAPCRDRTEVPYDSASMYSSLVSESPAAQNKTNDICYNVRETHAAYGTRPRTMAFNTACRLFCTFQL